MTPNAAPWVEKTLTENWTRLEKRVPERLLPRRTAHGKRFRVEEYGCGHYGCVAPTSDPGIVFKLTTDGSEAAFVSHALQIGEFPDGIVRYQKIFQIPEASYRRRPIYALWREEAYDIGDLDDKEALDRVFDFKTWAHDARERLKDAAHPAKLLSEAKGLEDWAYRQVGIDDAEIGAGRRRSPGRPKGLRSAYAVAWNVRACEIIAEMMANEPGATLVGEAFTFYLEQGILLADVHKNNIGRVTRADYTRRPWAITDPGHMMPLRPDRMDFSIDQL